MNFLARHLSTRFAALHQSSRSYPELQSRAANARGQYRNYALTGLAILALALLTLPLAQTKSSAHGGKGPEVQKHGPRFAKAPNKTPVSILAQPNDVCAGAIPIALRQSVDGSFSTATND
ncbi:MAG TPA: hypothetical protein VK619_13315, partial [Pyrinomonadaceae bacterium]|nr:hypothetical protein [Pyrinomonadaceae bacterium]